MKPNTLDRAVTGNLQGDRITMGFAAGAEKHLMGMMASMYSDMELAIIREYSTNAHDSHLEAGQTRPIEVTLPSPLSPYLKVKDYGVGMSVDDIHATYAMYGASTKRDSNEFNGMLGIGSKSALAYSGQFTVVAVKDGVRTTVAVTRDQDGSNTMVIVDTSSTQDGNGVEIAIPVKGGNQIESKARNFFRYWPKGSVLLNGEPPKTPDTPGIHISDTIELIKSDRYGGSQSIVVMGNVPYPAGDSLSAERLGIPYGHAIVARVGVGDVDFAPSREALTFSKHTNDCLAIFAAEFKAGLIAAVQKEIEAAPTAHAAVKAMAEWGKILGRNKPASFRHKGRQMPTTISPPEPASAWTFLITAASNYNYAAASTLRTLDLEYVTKAVFVTGFNLTKHTVTHKKKLLQWLENDSPLARNEVNNFILLDFPLDTHWIDPNRVVDWSTIQLQKLPSATNGGVTASGRLPGSYDIIERKVGQAPEWRTGVAGDTIDRAAPVFWVHGNHHTASNYTAMLNETHPAYTVICLGANRIEKFKRDNPTIINVSDAVKQAFTKWQLKLTKDDKAAMAIASEYALPRTLNSLGKASVKVADPAVQAAIAHAKIDATALRNARSQFERFGFSFILNWDNPLKAYPLVNSDSVARHLDASIEYMNMIYAKRQNGGK